MTSSNAISLLSIVLAFAIVTVGVWKKVHIVIVTLVATALVALLNGMSIIGVWTGPLMEGLTAFAIPNFTVIVSGALFAKLMAEGGAALSIANQVTAKLGEKWSVWGYILVGAILTYCGVSAFVIIFMLVPIAKSIYRKTNTPWFLYPMATNALMFVPIAFIPGCLQLHNIIPTRYLDTDLMAGPLIAIVGFIIYMILFVFYNRHEIAKARKDPSVEGYLPPADSEESIDEKELPNFWISILPLVVVIVLINLFKLDITYGMLLACILSAILFHKQLFKKNVIGVLSAGITDGITPVILVGMVVGLGKVMSVTPAFALIRDTMMSLPLDGWLKIFSISNVFSMVTGSATGSLSLTLEMFAKDFLAMGYSAGAIHRMMLIFVHGFDTLPWNSAIILGLSVAGLTHKQSYKQMFVVSVLFPIVVSLVLIAIVSVIPLG